MRSCGKVFVTKVLMSHSHEVLFPRVVTEEELRQLVEAEGGQWQRDSTLPQGFIGDADVWIFIRGFDNQTEAILNFTAEELAEVERARGQKMVACLSVDHTKGEKGDTWAGRIIETMVARWQGHHFEAG